MHVLLCREGWDVNIKKACRIYPGLWLQLRNKTPRRRVKAKSRDDRRPATAPNETWAMDFVHDQLATGKRLRAKCLNAYWFLTLDDARLEMEEWRRHYNEDRPHGAIGNKCPIALQLPAGVASPSS